MAHGINVAGVMKVVSNIYVNVSGTWKECREISTNVGAAWKDALIGDVTLTARTGANKVENLTTGTAVFRFEADGTLMEQTTGPLVQLNASTDWVIPNGQSDHGTWEMKWVQVSGDAPTNTVNNVAENTWTTLPMYVGAFAGGSIEAGVVTVSVRLGSGSTLDSANFEWNAIDPP